jgi:PKD repeat protein
MKKLLLVIIALNFLGDCIFCQNYSKIYGDNLDNKASVIKQFGAGVYIAGLKVNNGITYATISKLEEISGAILWQKELNLPSEIMDLEYMPLDPNSGSPVEGIIIVGRTLPFTNAGLPQDNKSFIFSLDASTGNIIASKLYDSRGRESFNRIIRHPNPANSAFPYYVLGSVNVNNNPSFPPPSSVDNVVLVNLNVNLVNNYFSLYSGLNTNISEIDLEFSRGIIPLNSSNILLVGNRTNAFGWGALVKINGLTGAILYATSYQNSMDILDGIELSTGDILVTGEYFPMAGSSSAFVGVLMNSDYSFKNHRFYSFGTLRKFKNIYTDGTDFFVCGQIHSTTPSFNVALKLTLSTGPGPWFLSYPDGRYFYLPGESSIDEACTFYSAINKKFYLAESKLGNSSLGGKDIFIEKTNMDFINSCSENINIINLPVGTDGSQFDMRMIHVNPTAQLIGLSPLNYRIQDHCISCNMKVDISSALVSCYQVQLNSTVISGTAPFVFAWDINCNGGPYDYTIQNPIHIFPNSGTYNVCLTVTDAAGCTASDIIQIVVPPDITPPNIMCPPDITLSTDLDKCTAKYNAIVIATDNCDQDPKITCTATGATIGGIANSAFIYNKGVTEVECVATDDYGNKSICKFTVTVKDQQLPTIICPPNQVHTIPFCDGGKIVTFSNPIVSDNCPMSTFNCSKQSGEFLTCGNNIIVCTATDMSGNTASCSFSVDINCNCISIIDTSLNCGVLQNTYDFVLEIQNQSGSGLPCALAISLDPLQGTITTSPPMWDVTNSFATIQGTIDPVDPIPPLFNITVNANCTCANGQMINCVDNISLVPRCCLEAQINDAEICIYAEEFTIPVLVNGGNYNITQVKWFIKPYSCDPGVMWTLYQESDLSSTVIFPPFLSNNPDYSSGFCMYAVVSVSDFPCAELESNIAHFKFCDYDSCRLELSQQYCYVGTPIVPNSLNLTVVSECSNTIDWIDPTGNLIPGQTGQFSYQPPPLNFTLSNDDCFQTYKYGVQISGLCGIRKCFAEITLFNNEASVGTIEMNPFESQPFCPGEDATLTFLPNCPIPPPPVEWNWYYKQLIGTSGLSQPLSGAGSMNPLIQSNRLWEDTWYYVKTTNGVCPTKQTEYFIDVRDNLNIIDFTAESSNICMNNGVNLSLSYLRTDCDVHITWYKDGLPIFSSIYSGSPANYNYFNPDLNGHYNGNYYAEIKSTCCENQMLKTKIDIIGPPMELVLKGPCFWCSGDVNFEVEIMNSIGNPSACTVQWYKFNDSGVPIIITGATSSTLVQNCGGHYLVKVICGGCELSAEINVEICNLCIVNNQDIGVKYNILRIFPNPAKDYLSIFIDGQTLEPGMRIQVMDLSGHVVKDQTIEKFMDSFRFSIANLNPALYYIRANLYYGGTLYGRFIKL